MLKFGLDKLLFLGAAGVEGLGLVRVLGFESPWAKAFGPQLSTLNRKP